MTEEKKQILDKINAQILKLKLDLVSKFPSVHEIDDGFIVRYFTDWDNCDENTKIRFKKIPNVDKPEEKLIFFYIPKDAIIEHKVREYVNYVACLSGKLELEVNGKTVFLDKYTKVHLESNEFHGKALENTYLLTTNTI